MGTVLEFPGQPPPEDPAPPAEDPTPRLPSVEDIADFTALVEVLDGAEGATFWATVIRLRATLDGWVGDW